MSGIVGIINLDGAPVDRRLLQQMTAFMAYRGPDGQDIWIDGHIGFGHTMLRTTSESVCERQPWSLDGQVWITADARVDGRADLIGKLTSQGCTELQAATDVELILHSYHTWGEDCFKHVLGDFAVAIWDGRRQRLICARDHFGVKPFYYAHKANFLAFSNTLDCIRLHPEVSDELNDVAIADFLLFDFNQDPTTTTFTNVRRLPPAHYVTWSEGAPRLSRYWTLPVDGHIRYNHASDYVDHFRELLQMAVNDRLRTDDIAVFMSGGLDSTSVAATAHELLSRQLPSFDLRAYTVVYDRLIPDEERHYSGLAAEALGIPIHYLVADNYAVYERWEHPELYTPEPDHNFNAAINTDQNRQIAADCRVALTGYGGDPALGYGSGLYVIGLIKDLQFGRLWAELGRHVLSHRRIPGLGIRTTLKRWLGRYPWKPPYPVWLNKGFAARLELPARWEQLNNPPASIHRIRPLAYENLTNVFWPYLFETSDPGVTLIPVEARHPFFDIRLLHYLLAIPPLPWFENKELLRVAMRGLLPEPVRLRPKALLAGDPVLELLRHCGTLWSMDQLVPEPELTKYVDTDAVPKITGDDSHQLYVNLRPLSLNHWFWQQTTFNYRSNQEVYDEIS